MREIKFRAWHNVTLSSKYIMSPHEYIVKNCGAYFCDNEKFPERIIMQFTGLTDKNGVDIYEGDIISFMCDDEVYNREVKYDDGGFCVNLNHEMIPNEYCPYLGEVGIESVLGNIHENPEFLCAKK